jgi:hypothetical protein
MKMEAQLFLTYVCKVKARPKYKGRDPKYGVKKIDGDEFSLFASWMQGKNDPYPGEYAMTIIGDRDAARLYKLGITWISEGDVEILREL